LVLFSSSGNSSNLLPAIRAARKRRAISISVLGKDGGLVAGQAQHEIIVPIATTARVQEVHTLILHSWLEHIEAAFSAQ
jgi:D-sedoheptulose 7-phosphate isomerase